jgi:dihydroorotate dehydrogenase
MNVIERAGLGVLQRLDPETAHDLALKALRLGIAPMAPAVKSQRLAVRLAGFDLPNPVGLAAGFDKNAVALAGLLRAGFGFLEVGGVTPRAQEGNARPRLFRLVADQAVINRFGFNNEGARVIAARLAQRPAGGIVGLNLGANKDSPDRAGDFAAVLAACGPYLDFATVNVSSPNTERLRDLQGAAALGALLQGVMDVRDGFGRHMPIFLKIAPDLDDQALAELAEVAVSARVDAIIATNTTLARDNLRDANAHQSGGLSGKPLFEKSTRVLARLSQLLDGRIPLIGVGGIDSGAAAYEKIRAGASAVQLYSALAFHGLSLVGRINRDLDALLARDGFATVADAVGSGRDDWL